MKYIFGKSTFLLACLAFIASPALAQSQNLAIEFTADDTDDPACSRLQGRGVYLRNTSASQPMMATIEQSWVPPVNGEYTLPFTATYEMPLVVERSPTYLGVFIKPGERRRLGCKSILWNPQNAFKTEFTYTLKGAYATSSSSAHELPESPERYLKLIWSTPGGCGGNESSLLPFNFHPERAIWWEYEITTSSSATPRHYVHTIQPLSTSNEWFDCPNTPGYKMKIIRLQFVSEPRNR